MKKLIYLLIVLLSFFFISCGEDDNTVTPPKENPTPWVGKWLSTGDNVAPILVSLFKYDSVRVTMNEDKTVKLDQHIKDGAWLSLSGVYNVTKSTSGSIHSIKIAYEKFEQEGIIEITKGNPDMLKLEAVQTIPNSGFAPRTPKTGFGSDATLKETNIQKYVRVK